MTNYRGDDMDNGAKKNMEFSNNGTILIPLHDSTFSKKSANHIEL